MTTALAIGQLIFKRIGIVIHGMDAPNAIASMIRQPVLYLALAIYGAATLLWIWILGRVSLMQAYPWSAAGVILVPLLSSYFYSERVGPLFWLGATLIAVGIVFTQYARPG